MPKLFNPKEFVRAPSTSTDFEYTRSVLEQNLNRLDDDLEYAKNKLRKALEEKAMFEKEILNLEQQINDLEKALETFE